MASEAVENFVDAREGDAFGLTLFGSYAIRWVPLTRDLDAIRNALPFADPRRQPMHMGGTRIGHALQFCLGNIATEAVAGDRMIILVSDGISSDLSNPSDSLTMADDLTASNITLFHVHVGTGSVPGLSRSSRVRPGARPSSPPTGKDSNASSGTSTSCNRTASNPVARSRWTITCRSQ